MCVNVCVCVCVCVVLNTYLSYETLAVDKKIKECNSIMNQKNIKIKLHKNNHIFK